MNCGIGETLSNIPMAKVNQTIQPLRECVPAIIAPPVEWLPAQVQQQAWTPQA
jgi:hypothetical protein